MNWDLLKLQPTKDKKAIRDAYRAALEHTNPEEKPEEFKALRAAYEEALEYASTEETIRTEKDDVALFREKLEELYHDFKRRKDLREWEALFAMDVVRSLDQRMKAEGQLFDFFLEDYFIPHEVWVLIDSEFHVMERLEEFYENYPRGFVDYVLVNGIRFPDTLPMDLFIPGEDGEEAQKYLNLFLRIRRVQEAETDQLIREMFSLKEQHPYGNALVYSIRMQRDHEDLLEKFGELQKQYPQDDYIGFLYCEQLHMAEKDEECRAIAEEILNEKPGNNRMRWLYAHCLAKLGKYEEAVLEINELMRHAGGNQQQLYDLDQQRQKWNQNVIEEKKAFLRENPDDLDARLSLAWAYLENNEDEKAKALSAKLTEDNCDPFDYHNLMSNLCYYAEDYQGSIGHLDALIELIQNMKDDGTVRTRRRMSRLGEMYGRKGYNYFTLGDEKKAEECYKISLEESKEKAERLTELAEIYMGREQYEKAMTYCRELVKERPDSAHGFLILAFAAYYLNEDNEAFTAVNRALDLDGSNLDSYMLKVRILVRNEAYEEAEKIVAMLEDANLKEHPTVLFLRGLLYEYKERNSAEAIRSYEASLQAMEGNETAWEFSSVLIYRLLCLKGDTLNANKEEDRNLMLELCDRGLACEENHYGLRDYKAWLLVKAHRYEEALEIYFSLEKERNHGPAVESQIGYIYYQDLANSADKALEYYQKSLEKHGDDFGYFYTGMSRMYLGEYEAALVDLLTLRKLHPEELDSYYRLSYVYAFLGEYNQALASINKTLEFVKDRQGDQSYYYYRKVQLLRRMERANEAIETAWEMIRKYDYGYGYKLIFDICIQFGMYERAKEHLRVWLKSRRLSTHYYSSIITLDMLEERYFKAKLNKTNYAAQLSTLERGQKEHQLAWNDRDFKTEIKVLQKLIASEQKEETGDISREYLQLSFAYFHAGNTLLQKEYAKLALEEIEKRLSENRLNRLLYLARKVRALSLSGSIKEALELMKEGRKHPLCDNCPYHTCKDLDLFEVELYEVSGETEKAIQLAEEYSLLYPDEEEFLIYKNCMKKGK